MSSSLVSIVIIVEVVGKLLIECKTMNCASVQKKQLVFLTFVLRCSVAAVEHIYYNIINHGSAPGVLCQLQPKLRWHSRNAKRIENFNNGVSNGSSVARSIFFSSQNSI